MSKRKEPKSCLDQVKEYRSPAVDDLIVKQGELPTVQEVEKSLKKCLAWDGKTQTERTNPPSKESMEKFIEKYVEFLRKGWMVESEVVKDSVVVVNDDKGFTSYFTLKLKGEFEVVDENEEAHDVETEKEV